MRVHQARTNDGIQGWICQFLETGVELEAPQTPRRRAPQARASRLASLGSVENADAPLVAISHVSHGGRYVHKKRRWNT
jgi:hypothetical protein